MNENEENIEYVADEDSLILPSIPNNDSHTHKCLLCFPVTSMKESKIQTHLKLIHNAQQFFVCKRCNDDPFIGSKEAVNDHFAKTHDPKNTEDQWLRFIVSVKDDRAQRIGYACFRLPEKTNGTRVVKKRQKVTPKKPLVKNILSSSIIGPTNWNQKSEKVSSDPVTSTSKDVREELKEPSATTLPQKKETVIFLPKKKNKHFPLISVKPLNQRFNLPFFCLFCDELEVTNVMEAEKHFRQHLGFAFRCEYCGYSVPDIKLLQGHYKTDHPGLAPVLNDDRNERRSEVNWINDFLNQQFKLALHDSDDEDDDEVDGVRCSICVKAGDLDHSKAYTFSSLEKCNKHFLNHTRWNRVDCTICGETVPNSDVKLSAHLEEHSGVDSTDVFQSRESAFVERFITKELENNVKEFWENKKRIYNCKECQIVIPMMDSSRFIHLLEASERNLLLNADAESSNDSLILKTDFEIKKKT